MTTKPEILAAYQCPECDTIFIEEDLAPLYECSRCGGTSTERRCEECNIFTARAGVGCEDCAVECHEVEYVVDHDDTMILAEDWDPEEPKATRDATSAAQQASERAAAKERAREERSAVSEAVPASALAVGDWIMNPKPYEHDPDSTVEVQALYDWGSTLGLVVAEYGMAQVFPVAPDHQFTRVPDPTVTDRKRDPFGAITFNPNGGAMSMSSAPRPGGESFTVEASSMLRNAAPWGEVPCLVVERLAGNMLAIMGVFIDRTQAEVTLVVWEQAVRALAEARAVEPVASRDQVEVKASEFTTHTDSMGRAVRFTLGMNEWGTDPEVPYLNVELPGSNVTLGDPAMLLGAVEAVRENLGHLNGSGDGHGG